MKKLKPSLVIIGAVGAIMVIMACSDQPGPDIDLLSEIGEALPETAGPWRVASPISSYTPETLFEYINGHAEVYLAYGLRASIAQRYAGPEDMDDIVVDVFELATPADAYGVFTHDQDGEEIQIGQGALFRYGWLSFWKGPFFVSIYAEGESDRARQAVIELGHVIAAAISVEGAPPAVVQQLPTPGLVARSVRYLHHPNMLAVHLPFSREDLLQLGNEAVAALGRYERDGERAHLLLVSYAEPATAKQASEAFGDAYLGESTAPWQNPDGWYAIRRLSGETEVLAFVIGAESIEMAETLLEDMGPPARGGSK